MENPKQRTLTELKQIIPDEAIRAAYLQRADIASLSPAEQEERFQAHLKRVDSFLGFITDTDSYVVGGEDV